MGRKKISIRNRSFRRSEGCVVLNRRRHIWVALMGLPWPSFLEVRGALTWPTLKRKMGTTTAFVSRSHHGGAAGTHRISEVALIVKESGDQPGSASSEACHGFFNNDSG